MQTPVSDCFVSVVAPVLNDGDIIRDFVTEVMAVLQQCFSNYELVLVDDGSSDDSVSCISALLSEQRCIRLLRLSRSFGEETAIAAGLDSVIGDYVVIMLPNSDPPTLIPDMVASARNGSGIVYGIREQAPRDPLLQRLGRRLFYAYVNRVLKLDLPRDSSVFRVLDRRAVNAITQIKDRYRFLRVMSASIGYSYESFVYRQIDRGGKGRKRSLIDAINQAITLIVTNSTHPLRLVSWLGIVAGLFNVLYSVYVVLIYLLKNQVAEGWTTLSLQNSLMFFVIAVILTVICEYLGHLLAESKDRPLYYVLEERNSAVMVADQERRNVVSEEVAPL